MRFRLLTFPRFIFHMLPARKPFSRFVMFASAKVIHFYLKFTKKIRVTPCNTSGYKFVQVAHKFLYKYGWFCMFLHTKKGTDKCRFPSYLYNFCYISYFTCWFQLDSDGPYNPFSCSTFHRSLPLDIPDISLSNTRFLTNSVICLGFIF